MAVKAKDHRDGLRERSVAAAEKGAEWLDERMPGWEKRINLPSFDLASGCGCVLGQLMPDWVEVAGTLVVAEASYLLARDRLGLSVSEAYEMGFTADPPRTVFSELQEAWEDEIARRRSL